MRRNNFKRIETRVWRGKAMRKEITTEILSLFTYIFVLQTFLDILEDFE